jgi:hypothetical protein
MKRKNSSNQMEQHVNLSRSLTLDRWLNDDEPLEAPWVDFSNIERKHSKTDASLRPTSRRRTKRKTKIFPRTDIAVKASRLVKQYDESENESESDEVHEPPRTTVRQEEGILEQLSIGRLPEELVLQILTEVVQRRFPRIDLKSEQDFILYREVLLGQSTSASQLRRLNAQALLETAVVRTDIKFATSEPYVHIPAFVADLPHKIHHLEIGVKTEIRYNRITYPIELYRPTRSIGSLSGHFEDLRSLRLVLDLNINESYSEGVLDRPCYCGYSATTTFRNVIEKLFDAVRAHGPGQRKTLVMRFNEDHQRHYAGEETSVLAFESSEDLLRAASKAQLGKDPKMEQAQAFDWVFADNVWRPRVDDT